MHSVTKKIQDGWQAIAKDSDDLISALSLVPRLDVPGHKGSSGRIGIIGGSIDYHGAPALAGLSVLRCGADMVEIFTLLDTTPSIRAQSPDLIVRPYLAARNSIAVLSTVYTNPQIPEVPKDKIFDDNEWTPGEWTNYGLTKQEIFEANLSYQLILSRLPSLHALVIGPGLGSDILTTAVVRKVILHACWKGIPMVIDADGIRILADKENPCLFNFLLSSNNHLGPDGKVHTPIVLTPNRREFSILSEFLIEVMDVSLYDTTAECRSVDLHNVSILCKNEEDTLWMRNSFNDSWHSTKLTNAAYNSGRRCSGQGDVLSGILGCYMGWLNISVQKEKMLSHIRGICQASALILRTSAIRAYYNISSKESTTSGSIILASYPRARGLLASDIVNELASGLQVLESMLRTLIWTREYLDCATVSRQEKNWNPYMEAKNGKKVRRRNMYKGSGWFTDNWNPLKPMGEDCLTSTTKSSESHNCI